MSRTSSRRSKLYVVCFVTPDLLVTAARDVVSHYEDVIMQLLQDDLSIRELKAQLYAMLPSGPFTIELSCSTADDSVTAVYKYKGETFAKVTK